MNEFKLLKLVRLISINVSVLDLFYLFGIFIETPRWITLFWEKFPVEWRSIKDVNELVDAIYIVE